MSTGTYFTSEIIDFLDIIISQFDTIITHRFFYLIILSVISIYCFLLICYRPGAKFISLLFLRPFDRTISQYFASANTLLFISFTFFFITVVLAHVIWVESGDLKNPLIIIGGGTLIASYFLNSGIKLHTEMRDNALEMYREIKKPYLEEAIKIVNKYLSEVRRKCTPAEWNENGLTKKDIEAIGLNLELKNNITIVANYFEEVALSIRHREAQETLLEVGLLYIFINFYKAVEKTYIPGIREEAKKTIDEAIARKIYSNMDYLYHRWKPLDHREILRTLKPKFSISADNWMIVSLRSSAYLTVLFFTMMLILWFFSCHAIIGSEITNKLSSSADNDHINTCFKKLDYQ